MDHSHYDDPAGELGVGSRLHRDYVDRSEFLPTQAWLIAGEDQLFPDHSGFDWKNIRKAMEYNKRKTEPRSQ